MIPFLGWFISWVLGVRLWEKLPKQPPVRIHWKGTLAALALTVIALFFLGADGLVHFRPHLPAWMNRQTMAQRSEEPTPRAPLQFRHLTKLVSTKEILDEVKRDEAKAHKEEERHRREQEKREKALAKMDAKTIKQLADREIARQIKSREARQKKEERKALAQQLAFVSTDWGSTTFSVSTTSGPPVTWTTMGTTSATAANMVVCFPNGGCTTSSMLQVPSLFTKIGSRKPPFCRVTCTFHHGQTGDVETKKEFCEDGKLPQTHDTPGWAKASEEYEFLNGWPGPLEEGFEGAKLYWKDKP